MKRAVGTTLMLAGGAAAGVIATVVATSHAGQESKADEERLGQRHCPNCGRFISRYGECRHCAGETGIASGCLRQGK